MKKPFSTRVYALATHVFKLLTPLMHKRESRLLRKHSKSEWSAAPVFIIGTPRSGSTILYQCLTNYFITNYFNNLSVILSPKVLTAAQINHLIFKEKPHNAFSSKLGNTYHEGLNAPAEAGSFWYHFIPYELYYYNPEKNSEKVKTELLKSYLKAISNLSSSPFIYKNLNVAGRLQMIKEIAPEAKFIHISRNPFYSIQSILIRRKQYAIPDEEWWSVKPENYPDLKDLPLIEKCSKQVLSLEKQINRDLTLFPPEQIHHLHYEDLCKAPEKTIKDAGAFLGKLSKRKNTYLPGLKYREKLKLPEEDVKIIRGIIKDEEREININ